MVPVAPRADYPRLEGSRILAPLDEVPVWSISCLFVARPWRRKGVSERLIEAAVAHARSKGAKIVESYPIDPEGKLWFRDLGQLPVVDDETRKFLGIVTRRDVLGAFDREVLKRNRLLAKVRAVEGTGFDYFELPEESRMSRIAVPGEFVGQTLAEAQMRARHGVTVMAIQRLDAAGREQRIAPRPDTRLMRGDMLVCLARYRRWIGWSVSEAASVESRHLASSTPLPNQTCFCSHFSRTLGTGNVAVTTRLCPCVLTRAPASQK